MKKRICLFFLFCMPNNIFAFDSEVAINIECETGCNISCEDFQFGNLTIVKNGTFYVDPNGDVFNDDEESGDLSGVKVGKCVIECSSDLSVVHTMVVNVESLVYDTEDNSRDFLKLTVGNKWENNVCSNESVEISLNEEGTTNVDLCGILEYQGLIPEGDYSMTYSLSVTF